MLFNKRITGYVNLALHRGRVADRHAARPGRHPQGLRLRHGAGGAALALIVTLICLLGCGIGVGVGAWLGTHLAGLYQVNFRFPFLDFTLGWPVVAAGAGISLLAALAGTGHAVYAAAGAGALRSHAVRTPGVSGRAQPSAG
ncbi:MAG TPA: hypothetical protein PKO45_08790 [Rubrivivax sp.]|nr:hypothetical protein [Rubrivivax sp.]